MIESNGNIFQCPLKILVTKYSVYFSSNNYKELGGIQWKYMGLT